VHTLPDAHTVGPVYPVPPHCPYLATVPVVDGTGTVVPGSVNVLVLWTVVGEAMLEDDFALDEPGAGAAVDAPGGGVVGTVAGWLAVFHDAVVATAVVATAGEVVPNGVGPGMA